MDVEGQVTFESTPELREHLLQAAGKAGKAVVVNLQKVRYMDSSGIAVLVEGLKGSQTAGKSFGLFGLNKTTRNVIELVRLDKVFRIFETEEEALRELA